MGGGFSTEFRVLARAVMMLVRHKDLSLDAIQVHLAGGDRIDRAAGRIIRLARGNA